MWEALVADEGRAEPLYVQQSSLGSVGLYALRKRAVSVLWAGAPEPVGCARRRPSLSLPHPVAAPAFLGESPMPRGRRKNPVVGFLYIL